MTYEYKISTHITLLTISMKGSMSDNRVTNIAQLMLLVSTADQITRYRNNGGDVTIGTI